MCREALEAGCDAVELHAILGVLELEQGRGESAVRHLELALQREPRLAVAMRDLVPVLLDRQQARFAMALAERAVARAPDDAASLLNLAEAALACGASATAVAALERARRCGAPEPRAGILHARAFLQSGDRTSACEVARALAACDATDEALAAAGRLFHELAELDEAETVLKRLLARAPRHLQGLVDLGAVCRDQGRVAEALHWWRRASIADPRSIEARYHLACALLATGRWLEGWPGHELRWRVRRLALPDPGGTPLWDGRPLSRGTLLVHHEQDLGDTLLFVRFLPRLLERVDRVVLVAQPALRRLLADAPMFATRGGSERGRLRLWAEDQPPASADAWVPLLSLPRHLGLMPEQASFGVPYLRAPPGRAVAWRERLAAANGPDPRALRIALVWRNDPGSPAARRGSPTAGLLAPLLQLPGIRWLVLHENAPAGELPPVGPGSSIEWPMAGSDTGADAFLELAAILTRVDLLITSDDSVAHLAGALGRPVWLVLPTGADWHWGARGQRSAWYPSMRLFRQGRPGDWASVVAELARSLAQLARDRGSPTGPVPTPAEVAAALRAHASGRVDEAAPVYRAWLRAHPDDARVLGHLSMAILAGADPAGDEPGELIARAVALRPFDADLQANHGVWLKRAGELEDAQIAWHEALRLDPGHRGASINLARLLAGLGRHEAARAIAERVLRARPDDVPARVALARVLADAGDLEAATAALEGCGAAATAEPSVLAARAAIRAKARDLTGAREDLHALLLARPADADAWSDLSAVERSLGRTELAVWLGAQALRLAGSHAGARLNLGIALDELGRHAEAERVLRRLLELEPGHPEAAAALGRVLLREGRFEEGFALCEARLAGWTPPSDLPVWNGGDAFGLRLMLIAERGFADAIQFVRYAAVLKRLGAAEVVIGCRARIARLLAGAVGVDQVVADGAPLPPVDAVAPLSSLPHRLGTSLASIPAEVPYLKVEPELVRTWAERLRPRPGLRVGLAWQGNPQRCVDRGRSLALADLGELLGLPGVRFIALQQGPGAEQIGTLPAPLRPERLDPPLDAGADGFLDTAAVIMNLDLVVTSDTALAHLAGALGRPVWLLLPPHAAWRWLRDRADSPWYPTMRLFRASERRDDGSTAWRPVVAAMARELAALRDGDRSRLVPTPRSEPLAAQAPPLDLLAAARDRLSAGDPIGAAALAYRLLADRPGHVDAAVVAAAAALHQGEHALAELLLRSAQRHAPGRPEIACNLALALKARGATEEAERLLVAAATHRPLLLAAPINLANLRRELHRPAEALEALAPAIRAAPQDAKVLRARGNLLRDLGRHDEAIAALSAACAAAPADPETALDHALALLAAGRLREGFAAYEVRWATRALRRPDTGRPLWDGSAAPGRTLLVHAEQGLGDTIQFARFLVPAARRWGGRVLFACQPALVALLRGMETGGTDLEIVTRDGPVPPHDAIVPLLSLPDRLGLAHEREIPRAPYLAADPARIAAWRPRLPTTRPRIGLVWQGNPNSRADRGRSPGLAALAPLLRLPGRSFVSLQREHGLDALATVAEAEAVVRFDPELDAGPDAFLDTAAVLAELDLVVGCDTAVMHLAGAMGRPCFLLLKAAADWRWLSARSDTPWYPRTRLFRQDRHGDWTGAVDRLLAAVRDMGSGVERRLEAVA